MKCPKVSVLNPEDRPGFGFPICPFFGYHWGQKEAGKPICLGCFGLSIAASRFTTISILTFEECFSLNFESWVQVFQNFPCLFAPVEFASFSFAAKS